MLNGESSHKDEGERGCLLNAPCAILNSSLPHGQDWHTPAFIFQATVLKCREIILAAFWTETFKHTKQHIPGGKENPHGHTPLQALGFQDTEQPEKETRVQHVEEGDSHGQGSREAQGVSPGQTPSWDPADQQPQKARRAASKAKLRSAFHV